MFRKLTLIAALGCSLSGAAFADSYVMDAKGKCHDASGKFAKQALCASHSYKLDAKGKCRDEKGKFAKATLCHV